MLNEFLWSAQVYDHGYVVSNVQHGGVCTASEEPPTIRPTALSRLQLRFENGASQLLTYNTAISNSDVDFLPHNSMLA